MNDDVKSKYLKAGSIAAKVRDQAVEMLKPGTLLLEVAEFVETEIVKLGGKPAFPVNLAIDSIAAHYTPHSEDTLRFNPGELVKLDLGVHVDGYIADTAVTVEIATNKWADLIRAASDSLDMVLDSITPGIQVRTLGSIIERTIHSRGFEPVSNLTGHSLERFNLHAGVSIPNIDDESIADLKPGMAVAIEPFATNGAGRVAGRKSGNIYKQLRVKETNDSELDALVKEIHDEFHFMPFPERWVAKRVEKSEKMLKRLLRHGILATYPILSEIKGGMVSQSEHTIIITSEGSIVTTR
ncbi:MAG: type II methionyl aminopeptidase [Candidatus Thermoplasmatota archaeon]|nr:type II methionyl aminopeptidase [Euryarchaeota archaeon]MBU4031915.1 type II methionyl aminopeptidase [Candidatus Thermoplasmatota archaeon]MBU4072191.1 type II methionyl aminopeptidase [Candidatus Thermoplasmatota archaeon]MBU4145007.1 type II methionyl aminopeptidase [Candidatus Thermoplasmatota archaeon]MBU4592021.1 type II methionyl aminopeptidase [Candidatus Thermoplasmatota archaeon]